MLHALFVVQVGYGEVEGEWHQERNRCCSRGREKEAMPESGWGWPLRQLLGTGMEDPDIGKQGFRVGT